MQIRLSRPLEHDNIRKRGMACGSSYWTQGLPNHASGAKPLKLGILTTVLVCDVKRD